MKSILFPLLCLFAMVTGLEAQDHVATGPASLAFANSWMRIACYDTFTVRGNSMTGLFGEGDVILVDLGYYEDHSISRNDVVLVRWVGNAAPLLKRVVGVPGDELAVTTCESRRFHLVINGDTARTSVGEAYRFDRHAARMFGIYIDSYKGRIPEAAYVVLGNLPLGSKDSSRFGWVGKSMVAGKVLRKL